jgi:hypothetical protein
MSASAKCKNCHKLIAWEEHAGGYWYHPAGNSMLCYPDHEIDGDPRKAQMRAEPETP